MSDEMKPDLPTLTKAQLLALKAKLQILFDEGLLAKSTLLEVFTEIDNQIKQHDDV